MSTPEEAVAAALRMAANSGQLPQVRGFKAIAQIAVDTLRAADMLTDHVTEYTFYPSSLRPGDREAHAWAITVSWKSEGRWAVVRGSECLDAEGRWDYERLPSARATEWKKRFRFSREEAIRIAREMVDTIVINGRTYEQWQDHFAELAAADAVEPSDG
jgi:hypothetical protein